MCLSTHPHCNLNIFLSHLSFYLWHLANNLPINPPPPPILHQYPAPSLFQLSFPPAINPSKGPKRKLHLSLFC